MDKALRQFRSCFLILFAILLTGRVFAEVEIGPFSLGTVILLEAATAGIAVLVTLQLLLPMIQKAFGFKGSLSSPKSTWDRKNRKLAAPTETPSTQPELGSEPPVEECFGTWQKKRNHEGPVRPWHDLRPTESRGFSPAPQAPRSKPAQTSATSASAKAPLNPSVPRSPAAPATPILRCIQTGIGEAVHKVSAFSEILFEEHQDGLDEEGRLCLTKLCKNVKQAQATLKSLTGYLEIEGLSAHFEEFNPSEVISGAIRELNESIRESQTRVAIANDLPALSGDRRLFGLVMSHLLDNGIKFNNKDERTVEISAKLDESNVIFAIKDNGIGIDLGEEELIFQPFVRGLRAGIYDGSGLGLAIVRAALDRLGGSIRLESVPGEGSTFFVSVTAACAIQVDAVPASPPSTTASPDVNSRYNRKGLRFS